MLKEPFQLIASVIGFGVLGAAMGILVVLIAGAMGALGSGWIWDAFDPAPSAGWDAFTWILLSMFVFGILGTALGGYVCYRITRSKDK